MKSVNMSNIAIRARENKSLGKNLPIKPIFQKRRLDNGLDVFDFDIDRFTDKLENYINRIERVINEK